MNKTTLSGSAIGVGGLVGLATDAGFTNNQLFVIFLVAIILTAVGGPLLSRHKRDKYGNDTE